MKQKITAKKPRDSGIELFRIITMFLIVCHHYVVNSGLMEEILQGGEGNLLKCSIMIIFGWGGKTGINCFVLITGFFMCRSSITLKKFLKLLLEVEFYKITIYFIFLITGVSEFTLKGLIKAVLPLTQLSTNFIGCYLIFFLFIPFLNLLIQHMNQKQHFFLMLLCFFVYTIMPSVNMYVALNYVVWFSIIYIIGAYIRLYPNSLTDSRKITAICSVATLVLSWSSVLVLYFLGKPVYFFVSDSNKILALLTAISCFCWFKNLKMGYHKSINTVAASTFGVLLIHANSDTMRQWLWQDTLQNVNWFHTDYFFLHAIASVVGIYGICTIIDFLRIRSLERPFFQLYSRSSVEERVRQRFERIGKQLQVRSHKGDGKE